MFLTKDRQTFVRAVAVLIAIQGLAWFALAVAGIIVKSSPPDSLTNTNINDITRYSAYLSRIIYNDLMIESSTRTEGKVIRPADFEAFLWIYAILSAVWVAASVDQGLAIKFKKRRQSYITLALGTTVLLTSVIDMVFFSLLARDFGTCPFELNPLEPTTTTPTESSTSEQVELLYQSSNAGTAIDCQLASGIVMSLAARGYVLWLINVVLAISLIRIGIKALRTRAILNYSGNNTIPRPKMKMLDQRKAPSPNNGLTFFGDNDVFTPASLVAQDNRSGTPAALSNKNQRIYF